MADKQFKRYGSAKPVEYSPTCAFILSPRSKKIIDIFTICELERLVAEMKKFGEEQQINS